MPRVDPFFFFLVSFFPSQRESRDVNATRAKIIFGRIFIFRCFDLKKDGVIEINARKFYRFEVVDNWNAKIAQICEANDTSIICLFRAVMDLYL